MTYREREGQGPGKAQCTPGRSLWSNSGFKGLKYYRSALVLRRHKDQEDRDSKLAQPNISRDPISKETITKKAGGEAQGVGSEFKPSTKKKSALWCWMWWFMSIIPALKTKAEG
jgi:hypothetical protein